MARWRWLLSAALAASAISCAAKVQPEAQNDNGAPVTIDEIPAPARDAILRHVGAGTHMTVHEGTGQGGEPVYGGRIYFGTYKLIIWVDAAGNVLAQRRIA